MRGLSRRQPDRDPPLVPQVESTDYVPSFPLAVGDRGGIKAVVTQLDHTGLKSFKGPGLKSFELTRLNAGGPRLAVAGEGPTGAGPYAAMRDKGLTGHPLLRSAEGSGGRGRVPQKPIPPYAKPLDRMGRATGVETTITKAMLDTGTKASRRAPGLGRRSC